MELLYLWIEDYKNIQKQGFNFSSQYRFDYNPESGELKVDENPNHIDDFFHKDISNVTAIIGENGAGKSNLLEFISYCYSKNVILKNTILLFKAKDEIKFISIEKELKILSELKLVFKKINLNDLEGLKIIYYCSILNIRDFSISLNDSYLINISTNRLLETDEQSELNLDIIESHTYKNIQRQIKFVIDFKEIKLPINIPNEIDIIFNRQNTDFNEISILTQDIYDLLKEKIRSLWDKINIEYDKLYKKFKDETPEAQQNRKDWIKINFLYNLIDNFFINLDKYNEPNLSESILHIKEEDINDITNLEIGVVFFEKQKWIPAKPILDFIKIGMEVIDRTSDFIDGVKSQVSLKIEDIERFYYAYQSYLDNFPKLQKNTNKVIGFISFSWLSLSSGEKLFLDLFSRFYDIVEELNDSSFFKIFIDEGETTFHPQWQKQYLKNLLDFFPQIFPDKQIQIILTSHSPFIASDLPNSNIIFLERNKEGKCVVKDSLNEMKQTFGANIHTLLTDSFFMKDGLMGDFAKEKINQVIAYLNQEKSEIPKGDDDTAQKYIHLIGEPIIRNQLQKILDSKRLEKIKEIDIIKAEISKLETRLKKLEDNDTNPSK